MKAGMGLLGFLAFLLVWGILVLVLSLYFTNRALKNRKEGEKLLEGEEQRNVQGILPRFALWGFLYPGIVFLVFYFIFPGIRFHDGEDIISGVLLGLVLLLFAVPMRRSTDIYTYVYSDHLVVKRRRLFLPGFKKEHLDYKDVKAIRNNPPNLIEVTRLDGSKINLMGMYLDYGLFEDYCKKNGVLGV